MSGHTPWSEIRHRSDAELHFVIDGPPGGPESGRFVELENERGESVGAGDWRERDNGWWELVIRPDDVYPGRDANGA